MAKRACADCGTALKTFTVCDACWQKVYCFCQTCGAPGTAGPGRAAEARVTGGLAGEPRLLANVIRKMTLHDWHLRLTQEEANALRQWVRATLDLARSEVDKEKTHG